MSKTGMDGSAGDLMRSPTSSPPTSRPHPGPRSRSACRTFLRLTPQPGGDHDRARNRPARHHGSGHLRSVQREGETFSLTANGELRRRAPRLGRHDARKEWFFHKLWAEMPAAVRTGHPRPAPGVSDSRTTPIGPTISSAPSMTSAASTAAIRRAGRPAAKPARRLLDVGGGAGSAFGQPGPSPKAFRQRFSTCRGPSRSSGNAIRSSTSSPVTSTCPFRPAGGGQWDYVLVSNILHDHPAAENERIIREAAGLLAPGGSLVIYEWVIDEGRTSPPGVASFTPMMVIENEGGWTWTESK